MLLVIRFHALSDLFHDFRSINGALRFEIITFRIILFSYDNHLIDPEYQRIEYCAVKVRR